MTDTNNQSQINQDNQKSDPTNGIDQPEIVNPAQPYAQIDCKENIKPLNNNLKTRKKQKNVNPVETIPIDNTGMSLFIEGFADFRPTGNMLRLAYNFIYENPNLLSETQLCEKIGLSRQIWYKWLDGKYFRQWWDKIIQEKNLQRLDRLYDALYVRGLTQSDVAAKVFIERWDNNYKPKSAQELEITPQVKPEEEQALVEAGKKYVDVIVRGEKDGQ